MSRKRACVIGAGISGLPTIKACLEEGIDVVCYEKTSDLGGLWNYRSFSKDHSTVMINTVVNTSKEMMCFSDFPPPAHYPNFMHNSLVLEYLRDYAKHFDLLKYIKYNTAVTKLTPAEDYEETGRWRVITDKGDDEIFDFAFVCTGHHAYPVKPHFEGLDKFQGEVLHTQSLHDPSVHRDKRVLIIGIGNSSMDAAVGLAPVSKQVIVSTRTGTWVWSRVARHGLPFDCYYFTRFWREVHRLCPTVAYKHSLLPNTLELQWANVYTERICTKSMDHDLYGLKPKHHFYSAHPTINDALPTLLCSGEVVIKGNVKRFTTNSVVFEDDTEEEIDLVLLATGYTFAYPFLEPQSLVSIKNNVIDAYYLVFPANMKKQTLALIGLIQPIGSISPISEMQARWAARIFAGRCQLAPREQQRREIDNRRAKMRARYIDRPRHTIQVDYYWYMDELADFIGAGVSIWRELLSGNFEFAMRLIFGPYMPYYFRLNGPHAWSGARQAIETSRERIRAPMRQRSVHIQEFKNWPISVQVTQPFRKLVEVVVPALVIALIYTLYAWGAGDYSAIAFVIALVIALFIGSGRLALLMFARDTAIDTM